MKGIIVENSLSDTTVLDSCLVVRSWADGDWKLHEVEISLEQAMQFASYLNDGPWYIHFWEPDSDDVLVVFKGKTFSIKHSDSTTWKDAIAYGISIGIPKEQLDFPTD